MQSNSSHVLYASTRFGGRLEMNKLYSGYSCRNPSVVQPYRLIRDREVVTAYREASLAASG
jgi:hypothetical protein